MITFFIFICLGYLLLAFVSILDKFILNKSLSASTYTFYSTFFFFGAFLLLPFCTPVTGDYAVWGILSSLAFGFGAWPMYIAMQKGEATHVVPFIGATTTLSVLGFSYMLFGDVVSGSQMIGVALLVVASMLFAYEKSIRHQGFHIGYAWATLSGFLFGLSHVSAKYFYTEYDFITGLVWTKGFAGIVAFLTLLSLVTQKELFANKKKDVQERAKKSQIPIVILSKIFALGGTVLIQYAIAVGSVVVVNALVGLQYALVLIFALVLTKLYPKFFKEYFTKSEIKYEFTAIILVVIGIIFLI